MNVLYISYDGMLEPLGQSQVLRYLEQLSSAHKIVLISFEKESDYRRTEDRNTMRRQIASSGIIWIPLRYHKRPSALATLFDITQGIIVGAYLTVRHRIQIVHARSYVPSVMALWLKRIFRVKYIFDMRGFWADERVDGGLWPAGGRLYRVAKRFEKSFLLNADCVVSLTQTAINEMRSFAYLQGHMPYFQRITTCTDLELFKPGGANENPSPKMRPFTLGYVGSVGVWYLFDEVLHFFKLLRGVIPDARLHILNREGADYIHERMTALNVDRTAVNIESTDPSGVAQAMQSMDAGIFFIKPCYSKMASAPTKLGEFLACGVPCIGNAGVGDMEALLEDEGVGLALNSFDEATMLEAINRLLERVQLPDLRQHCRDVAARHFSLVDGVAAYNRIYRELGSAIP